MKLSNFLKQPGYNRRGYYAIVHEDTGRIYAKVAVNITQELGELLDALKAGRCPNATLQKYYNASPEFTAMAKVSKDGMRGAKKDLGAFRSRISSYLLITTKDMYSGD